MTSTAPPGGNLPKAKTQNDIENEKIDRLKKKPIGGFSQKLTGYLEQLAPFVGTLMKVIDTAVPIVVQIVGTLVKIYNSLPLDILFAVFGLGLCFFGGTFAVSIAAFEAYMMVGFEDTKNALAYLWYEFERVKGSYIEDDQVDENNDGIADVQQISKDQLLKRKIMLFFSSIEDPEQVSNAWGGIVSGWMAVLATLKIEFAKVITLGVSIANSLRSPMGKLLTPVLYPLLGDKYAKWINFIINTLCKLIAVSIAWSIQKVVSAVHSAIKGGLMFSRHIIIFLNKRGILNIHHEDTYLDEIVGWSIAFVGILFQLTNFFSLPFPWNILFFPLTVMEWVLIWLIS